LSGSGKRVSRNRTALAERIGTSLSCDGPSVPGNGPHATYTAAESRADGHRVLGVSKIEFQTELNDSRAGIRAQDAAEISWINDDARRWVKIGGTDVRNWIALACVV